MCGFPTSRDEPRLTCSSDPPLVSHIGRRWNAPFPSPRASNSDRFPSALDTQSMSDRLSPMSLSARSSNFISARLVWASATRRCKPGRSHAMTETTIRTRRTLCRRRDAPAVGAVVAPFVIARANGTMPGMGTRLLERVAPLDRPAGSRTPAEPGVVWTWSFGVMATSHGPVRGLPRWPARAFRSCS